MKTPHPDKATKKQTREEFLQQANEDYLKAHSDIKAWAALEEERVLWESTLGDGLDEQLFI